MQEKQSDPADAETSRLHVGHLTRNVQQEHIQEIFSTFGTVKHVELAMDKAVNLPRGFAYVEFAKRSEAEEAQRLMDGGQLDGNQLRQASLSEKNRKVYVFKRVLQEARD